MAEKEASNIPSVEENIFTIMPVGAHIVKVNAVFNTKNGQPIKPDKNGNAGLEIVFINQAKLEISKVFYYSADPNVKCSTEFLLARLKGAMGLNPKEEQAVSEMKKKKVWLIVGKVTYIDLHTQQQIYNHDGNPVSFNEVYGEFYKYEEGGKCPIVVLDEAGQLLPTFIRKHARALKEDESLEKGKKMPKAGGVKQEESSFAAEGTVETKKVVDESFLNKEEW